jgi:hypothetical protein
MSKIITLNNGMECIVDDELYPILSRWKWKFLKATGCSGGYAVRNTIKNGKNFAILMHREINNTPNGLSTDHINGNKLDNRRSNLRSVPQYINMQNRDKQKNNKSGFKGVFFDKCRNKYVASIVINGKTVFRKRFQTLNEAAEARLSFMSSQQPPKELFEC